MKLAVGGKKDKPGCSEVARRQPCIHPTASNKNSGWEKVMKILESPKRTYEASNDVDQELLILKI